MIKTHNRLIICIAVIILLPLLIHFPILVHILNYDPIHRLSGLGIGKIGAWGIEPNDGFTSLALGKQAAHQIIRGHFPWWNHYEGIGSPLLGETQSAALFLPFTLFLLIKDGLLYSHISLEVIAGLCTFQIIRLLGLNYFCAACAAICFEFNGVFSWLQNAIFNPVAFLPMGVAGLQLLQFSNTKKNILGSLEFTAAIAWSLYAGFPEVAYIQGLFLFGWAVVTLFSSATEIRTKYTLLVILSGLLGLIIALPALIGFVSYLPYSNIGGHSGAFVGLTLPSFTALAWFLPYVYGNIFQDSTYAPFWASVGGYGGFLTLIFAIAGLFNYKILRKIRLYFAFAWLTSWTTSYSFGYYLALALEIVPGIKYVALYRYTASVAILCQIILAAFGLSLCLIDIKSKTPSINFKRIYIGSFLILLGALCKLVFTSPHVFTYKAAIIVDTVAIAFVILLGILGYFHQWKGRVFTYASGTLIVLEAILYYVTPMVRLRHDHNIDTRPIKIMAKDPLARFVTAGPFAPNFSSYFNLNSINYNDLPTPENYINYIQHNLSASTNTDTYFVISFPEVLRHYDSLRELGTNYLILPHLSFSSKDEEKLSAITSKVASTPNVVLYSIKNPKPYLEASHCTSRSLDRDHWKLRCPHPVQVVRRELMMPGWKAMVNGKEVEVKSAYNLFQSVTVPEGDSEIEFSFTPPYGMISLWAASLGILGYLALIFLYLTYKTNAKYRT